MQRKRLDGYPTALLLLMLYIFFFFFCVLSLDVKWFCVCAVMPVSANGLGISLGFTRFLNKCCSSFSSSGRGYYLHVGLVARTLDTDIGCYRKYECDLRVIFVQLRCSYLRQVV